MTTYADMDSILNDTFAGICELYRGKRQEYSENNDALSNFRRNARDLDMDMEAVWRVYAGKHWDAISAYVRDIIAKRERKLTEPIEDRIDDLIVYLCLFKAMVTERNERRKPQTTFSVTSSPFPLAVNRSGNDGQGHT